MKSNVTIETSDEERDLLANLVDGKVTKRLITRREIQQLCKQHIGGLLEQVSRSKIERTLVDRHDAPMVIDELRRPDPEDAVILAGKPESYVIGWNKVKRGRSA